MLAVLDHFLQDDEVVFPENILNYCIYLHSIVFFFELIKDLRMKMYIMMKRMRGEMSCPHILNFYGPIIIAWRESGGLKKKKK